MVAAMCLFGTTVFADESYPDQYEAGPNIYKKVFENDKLRVSEIKFNPGDEIPMHTHEYEHLVYIMEAGQLTLSYPDGKQSVIDGTVGQTMWIPQETHSAKNAGTTTMRALIIESK